MGSAALPSHAQVVIVGGGIAGCSTAWHLARNGMRDVIVLEKHTLTSGSTFHAAGLVGQLRSSAAITRLLNASVEVYRTLEKETGHATGWKQCGGLRLACTPARMTELERQATTARSFGLDIELLSPREARDLWPLMEIDDVVGASFLPSDGSANPGDIAYAMAAGARSEGVRFFEQCTVQAVDVDKHRVRAVETSQGRIHCETLVNCAGRWAAELGRLAGVRVPVVSVEHQYLITERIDGVPHDLPTMRDPDRLTYYKEEVGGLVMGGYEPNPVPCDPDRERPGELLPPDYDHFQQLADLAMPRVSALRHAGIRQLVNGAEGFTPDGNFILGEAPEVAGYFVAAGFNAFGIAAAGGAGQALAEWIVGGEAPDDLWPVDIRRFGAPHGDADWVRARTLELYGKHYAVAWPLEEHSSARRFRCSPLYERLEAAGACFGEKLGFERPNWFAPSAEEARDQYSFGRGNWFPHVGTEHTATREAVTLFDQTSFAKFELRGSGAQAALDWICAGDISKPPGSLTYTQMLNQRGGIECDLTVARLAEDHFYLVTGTGAATRDFHWIANHLPNSHSTTLRDVTEQYAVLALMGPRSREVLAKVAEAELHNDALPYLTVRNIDVAGHRCRVLRVTYVGELGYEIHAPIESAGAVYDALMKSGKPHGIRNAGYRAIESLRLEKGYRAWGSDLTPSSSPLEAGLTWAVKLGSTISFLGRDELERQGRQGLKRRLVTFTVADPAAHLFGRETIYRNGERVGFLSSGGFGHTIGCGIGLGYVVAAQTLNNEFLDTGDYELDVATHRFAAQLHRRPLYDPQNKRVHA
ncbi:MAG: FAD-dependent oxidoreductase [Deltaproteobacteria bacterium]